MRRRGSPFLVWQTALAIISVLLAFGSTALAGDAADEADLEFRIGAEAYQKGEYREALEHFLLSNRFVANRNVIYNIARSYQKLERYPEAFRYYTDALSGETDADAKARILAEIEQIRPHVAVVDVRTEPPGATIYVERKDLGPRGETPRALALAAGSYRVFIELSGYYPEERPVDVAVGKTTDLRVDLKPILGTLRVEAGTVGARVRMDDNAGPPRCVIPCRIEASPGRHVLHLALDGHRNADVPVDVVAQAESVVRPELEVITGTVLVTTDERGALIEADDQSKGFTPAIVSLPVGEHSLRVSLKGFRPIERRVVVLADRQIRVDEILTQAEEVTAASRVSESVEDAPSSVTIIPREEMIAFGYPTIVEAVRGTRGMYVWNDHSYAAVGVRGLGRPESYTNRELVLLDGHPTNDNWLGSAYVGYDARTDLADIDRIEVVRGPGSVLYGTNAFSGVINLVSRYRDEKPGMEAGISTADYGVGRARFRAQAKLGKDSGIWTSVAGAHSVGREYFFSEFADPTVAESGHSRNADGFDAGTVQGRVWWKWLTGQWFFHSHDKAIPSGEFSTLIGDPRTHQVDTRGFFEARAEPKLSDVVQSFTRAYINLYKFHGDYLHTDPAAGLEVDRFDGQWVGLEQRIVLTPNRDLRFTLGLEGQSHYKVKQTASDVSGSYLDEGGSAGNPYKVGAAYAVADATLSPRVRVSAGARIDAYFRDASDTHEKASDSSVNPRAAVILRPYDRGNLKILGGKAFRVPSIYELYYNDGGYTQVASPDLKSESIYSLEVEHTHRFSQTVKGVAAVYANYVKGLIVARGEGTGTDPIHYINSGSPVLSVGVEVGVHREWRQGWMLGADYGYQHSRFLASDAVSDLFTPAPDLRRVPNSPEHLASLKAAVPILGRGLTLANRVTVQGAVYDRNEDASTPCPPCQTKLDPSVIWDMVLTGREDRWGLTYSVGAYNVTDWRYSAPVSNEFTQDSGRSLTSIVQNGRTFLASANVRF